MMISNKISRNKLFKIHLKLKIGNNLMMTPN